MRMDTRTARALAVLALAGALAGCEDAIGPGVEVDIGAVVLSVGSGTTVIPAGGSGSLALHAGTHDLDVAVRDLDGDALQLGFDYELVVGTSNQGVARYSALTNLGGTLVTAPGTATLQVEIEHDGHSHFSEPVSVTVN